MRCAALYADGAFQCSSPAGDQGKEVRETSLPHTGQHHSRSYSERMGRWLVVVSLAEDAFEEGTGCERCTYSRTEAVALHLAVADHFHHWWA